MAEKSTITTTLSVIKADVGSIAGHIVVPEEMLALVRKNIKENGAQKKLINDFHIFNCGDDIEIVMTHTNGVDNEKIHELAWNAFMEATKYAREHKYYGAGQDLLSDTFSGNVKGQGPGVAEMEFTERKSDPVAIFACDKTDPAAFSLPLFKIFADPFNSAGLIIDPTNHNGFNFDVLDVYDSVEVNLKCPEEMYDLLALIGTTSRYAIKKVRKNDVEDDLAGIAAVICTEKLNLSAGKYVGKDDPVCIVRAQSGFPAMGEVLEGFTTGHLVSGWMRGSHRGPLMPVSQKDAVPTRFDGPPRVVGMGFQVSNHMLKGPKDLFDDISFDNVRKKCLDVADYMRAHGPFEPHRVSEKELEYTTLPQVLEKLKPRFKKI